MAGNDSAACLSDSTGKGSRAAKEEAVSRFCLLVGAIVLVSCSSGSGPGPDAGRDAVGEARPGDAPSGPRLTVSPSSVDFGRAECGGAAPAAKTLTLKNAGTAALQWNASLVGSGKFSLAGASGGTLNAGGSVDLTVNAAAVEGGAAAGQAQQATLSLSSNDPQQKNLQIPITLLAEGGQLVLTPASPDFGVVPVGSQATDIPLTLTNQGNKKVTVGFTQPADTQLTLAWTGSPADVELAPGASLPGLVARFKPTAAKAVQSSSALKVTGAICGTSATAIALSGEGSSGSVGVQPGSLDFGKVKCGATGTAQTIKLSNVGNASFTFDVKAAAGTASPYTVSPDTGSVAASGSVTIAVTPKPVPQTSLTTTDLYGDTLTITTTATGDTPRKIVLHQTAEGARLSFNPTSLSMGEVPINTGKSASLEVQNSGNATATVTLGANGDGFSVSPTAPTAVVGGSKLNASVGFTPTFVQAMTGNISLTTASGDTLCAPLPDPVVATGTGSNGSLAISSSELTFGDVDCGKQTAAQDLTLQNAGSNPFDWTAALGKGGSSPFKLSVSSGTLPAAGTVKVTITPSAIPSTASTTNGAFNDLLTITTTISGDKPHTVQLTMTARGAVLTIGPSGSLDFGNVSAGTGPSLPFTLQNSGNVPATVTLQITNSPPYSLDRIAAVQVDPGVDQAANVVFAPTVAGAVNATISLVPSSGTVLCAPLPTKPVTGTGIKGSVGVTPAVVDFAKVPCGSTAGQKTVTISNNGTAPFTFYAQMANGTYTLSTDTGTIDAGKSQNLTLTPPAIPSVSSVDPVPYDDTLTITTDVPGDTDHDVPVHMTPSGAILSTSVDTVIFNGIAVGSSTTSTFSVTNEGNAPATVTFSGTQSVFTFGPQGTTAPAAGSYSVTATFKPTAAQMYGDTVSLTVPTGTPLCGPLPSLDVSGEGE
jgi:hypothetical protein